MKNTCYMCSNESTSREHVPPKCIFPEKKDLPKGVNFRKSLITVPSCDEHNSLKSLDDEYLMFVLAATFQGNNHKEQHFKNKVMRAVDRKPHVFVEFAKGLRPILIEGADGKVEESACFKVDLKRFNKIVQHMACGIFFHHYQKKWLGGFKVFTNAFMDMSTTNALEVNSRIQDANRIIENSFDGVASLGGNEEIFTYKVYSNESNRHAIHMNFYQGIQVTVLLNAV